MTTLVMILIIGCFAIQNMVYKRSNRCIIFFGLGVSVEVIFLISLVLP